MNCAARWCILAEIGSVGASKSIRPNLGGEEQGVRGRQRRKQSTDCSCSGGRRAWHRPNSVMTYSGRFGRQPDAVRERLNRAEKRNPHGWLVGLSAAQRRRLPARGHVPNGELQSGIGTDAARSSPDSVAQALADGNSPGRGQPGALGRLSRRVRLPLQPAKIAEPRQAVLPFARAGQRGRSSPCRSLVKCSTGPDF
jgi:hypothetical protein